MIVTLRLLQRNIKVRVRGGDRWFQSVTTPRTLPMQSVESSPLTVRVSVSVASRAEVINTPFVFLASPEHQWRSNIIMLYGQMFFQPPAAQRPTSTTLPHGGRRPPAHGGDLERIT